MANDSTCVFYDEKLNHNWTPVKVFGIAVVNFCAKWKRQIKYFSQWIN